MKHSRWLFLSLLVFALFTFLVSCDMLGELIPGFGNSTTSEVTTVTTTDTVTTTVTTTTVTTTVSKPPVTIAPNSIVEKTPADLPVFNFDGDLTDYAVGYETGAESGATTLATALGKTAAAYDATVAKSIRLAVKQDGIVALGAGDYHIYVTKGTIHILGGDAAGLTAGIDAFLATVTDGTTALKAHEHTVCKATKPSATTAAALPQLIGTTTEDALGYSLGDEVIFVLRLTANGRAAGCKSFQYTISADDTEKTLSGTVDGSSGILAITVPADFTLVPGSVRLWVNATDAAGTPLKSPYDTADKAASGYTYIGGAVINFEDVSADVPEPSNFEEFWKSLIADLPDPTRSALTTSRFKNGFAIFKMDAEYLEKIGQNPALAETYDCYEVYLHCGDAKTGRPAVGYITVPKDKLGTTDSLPINIGLNSYSGGASSRDGFFATSKNAICVRMHPQGMPLYYYHSGSFVDSGLKDGTPNGPNYQFGIKGSDTQDPATADLTLMLLRNVQMLRYLTDEQYDNEYARSTNLKTKADKEAYQAMRDAFNGTVEFSRGGSMGGFQNIATAALCGMAAELETPFFLGTVTAVGVNCPWMCDPASTAGLTGRLGGGGTRIGSDGTEVNVAGLAYLDTIHFAAHLPKGSNLKIYAGFADTTCPSTGIAALYNATTVEKWLELRQNKDHSGSEPATKIDYTLSADAAE